MAQCQDWWPLVLSCRVPELRRGQEGILPTLCVCVRAGDLLISVLPQLAAHHVGPWRMWTLQVHIWLLESGYADPSVSPFLPPFDGRSVGVRPPGTLLWSQFPLIIEKQSCEMEKKRPHGSKVQLNVQVTDFSSSGNEFRVKDKWKITFSFLRNAQTDWSIHFAALLVDKWPYLVTTRHNLQHKQIYPSMSSDIVQNKPTHPSWTDWLECISQHPEAWLQFMNSQGCFAK